MGDFEAAISCYARAAELAPREAEFQVLIGETMALGGDLERGEEALRLSLKNDCRKSEYIYNALARVLMAQGNYVEAKRCYETALEINPEFVPAFAGRTDLERYEWIKAHPKDPSFVLPYVQPKQELLAFLTRFEGDPNQKDTFWIDYGEALASLWRYDEARRAFSRARQNKKEGIGVHLAWSIEGEMEEERGDYAAAQKCFENALAAETQLYIASFYLGHLFFRRGELERAEAVFRDTLKLKGDKDETLFNLGGILLAQERYEEAAQCYREAIEIDPDYTIAKIRLLDLELALRWMEKHGY